MSSLTQTPLTTYEYRLYATNILGASALSNTRSVTTPAIPPPSAPTGLIASALNKSAVIITWNDGPVEKGYQLERRNESTNSWIVVATLPANTTTYTNTGLTERQQYWFRVQAFNDYGVSSYSNEDEAVPVDIVNLLADDFDPGIDGGMWASNGSQGFRGSKALYFAGAGPRAATTIPLDVSLGSKIEFVIRAGNEPMDGPLWNNSETGENVLVEYSKDNGTSWTTLQTLSTIYPSLSTWSVFAINIPAAAVSSETQFRWRQLSNSGGVFDCWALEDVTIQGAAPLPPGAVSFIISSAGSSTSVSIFWIGADGASSYVIERRSGLQAWVQLATLPMLVNYYMDTDVIPGRAYSYRVKALNATGAGAYSLVTSSFTWTQEQQWVCDNYGNPDALSASDITSRGSDGTIPLLRFAFNISATETWSCLEPAGTSGYPRIWLDPATRRLTTEFVRRKASSNPRIVYQAQFSSDNINWTTVTSEATITSVGSMWERVRYEDTLSDTEYISTVLQGGSFPLR